MLLFLTPLWNEVKRGVLHPDRRRAVGAVVRDVGLGRRGVVLGSDAGAWSVRLSASLAFVNLLWVGLMFAKRSRGGSRRGERLGPARDRRCSSRWPARAEGTWPVAFLQLLAGAAFLGAVIDGLLLGHWYLTDRGLTRTPINRTTNLLFVGVGLEAAALLIGGFGPTEASSEFNPLLTSAGPGLLDRARDGRRRPGSSP